MKSKSVRAVLTASVLAAMSLLSFDASAEPKAPNLTPAVRTPISAAQKLMKNGDLKPALDMVHLAQAVPDRTPVDDYVINEFLGEISIGLKDYATADTAYEAMIDSTEFATDADPAGTLKKGVILAGNVKHYAKVIEYGQKLIALGPIDDKVASTMAVAYYYLKDMANAKKFAQMGVDAEKAAGIPPEQASLQILMNSQAGAHNEAGAEAALEQLAFTYYRPDDLGQLFDHAMQTKGLRDIDALYLNRLRLFAGASGDNDDDLVTASVALQMGYPGEARAALEHGIHAGTLSDSGKTAQLLTEARGKAAADERTLDSQIAAGKKAGGLYNVKLAEALYGYARYADAEASARRAQAAGGTKDPSEAPMVLGMSLAQEGKYADAAQVFQGVSGGAATNKAAHYWLMIVQHKGASATPPAAH